MKRSSTRVLYVSIAANIAIALSKYAAAALTGSRAMLAEAFHSTADSCNELLLFVGIKRSVRPSRMSCTLLDTGKSYIFGRL